MTTSPPELLTELMAHYRPIFREGFEKATFGEPLTWEISWGVTPTPQGPVTQFLCYAHCAATVPIGALLQRFFTIPIGASEQQIHTIVANQVEELRLTRSQAVNPNGVPPQGGLILPS